MLTKSTPEGARDYLVPSRVHPGEFYALPQSPQIFKQILMIAGMDRYFQIVKCFRDEDLRADRQPEFTQVDLEMSFATEDLVFATLEPLMERLMALIGRDAPRPFLRLPYAEAIAKYGSDKPDLRCGMEIATCPRRSPSRSSRVFRDAIAAGGEVRGFAVPGAAKVLAPRARRAGRAGEAARRRRRSSGRGRRRARPELGAQGGRRGRRSAARSSWRRRRPRRSGAHGRGPARGDVEGCSASFACTWRRSENLLDPDEVRVPVGRRLPDVRVDRRGAALRVHAPSVHRAARERRGICSRRDPGRARARAYDLVLNGSEIGGGSIRIHDQALQRLIFKLLGISDEEAKLRFGFFVDALEYGTPPHGGIALGLDRIVAILCGESRRFATSSRSRRRRRPST